MLIKEIIGNIYQDDLPDKHIEKILIENQDLAKRLHRVMSDHQNEYFIKLPVGKQLHIGDIIFETAENRVIIDVSSEDLLVIRPKTIREMGEIAHSLGNRHLPAQFDGDTMLLQYDYLVEDLLVLEQIPFTRETRMVTIPFLHVAHKHV